MTMGRSHRRSFQRGRVAATLSLLVAFTGVASIARAEPPSFAERHPELKAPDLTSETKNEAEARSKRGQEVLNVGNAAFDRGDFKTCEQQLAKVWMMSGRESLIAAAVLGQCESRLGYYVDAREHLSFALRGMESARADPKRTDPKRAAWIEEAKEELKTAEAHVSMLAIVSAPPGALISIGTKIKVTAPVVEKLVLYPGDYVLEVRVNGELVRSEKFHADPGVTYAYRFNTPKPPPPPEPDKRGPRVVWLALGGATAGAFAALGAGMLFASNGKLDEAAALRPQIGALYGSPISACTLPKDARVELCKKLDAATDSAAIFQYVGIASLITGGLFGAATTAYGVWPRASTDAKPPPAPAPPPAIQVVAHLVAGPGAVGVLVQGAW